MEVEEQVKEGGDAAHPVVVDESNSSVLFQLGTQRATITIKFNACLSKKSPEEKQQPAKKQVIIDARLPLASLKSAISSMLNVPQSEFVMRRTESSVMWKDLAGVSIEGVGLRHKSSIHVERGIQMKTTEYGLHLYQWDRARRSLTSLQPCFIVDKTTTVKNMKLNIQQHLLSLPNFGDEVAKTKSDTMLRLRNCVEVSQRVGKAWCNHWTLEESNSGTKHLKDGMEVAVEILNKPEELDETALLIEVQQWHPDLQTLGDSEEIVLSATTTVLELKEMLRRALSLQQVGDSEVVSISLGKPFAWQLKDPAANLPHIKWDKHAPGCELKEDLRLEHGSVLVYKDKSVNEIMPTDSAEGGAAGSAGRRGGGGGGIKIYSFAEQLERAAAKKIKEAEEKKAREDARGEMEERMKGIQGAAAAKGTNTEDISVGITSCSNTACKCTDCECGEKCTCGVSMEVTCDPCREFKFKKK